MELGFSRKERANGLENELATAYLLRRLLAPSLYKTKIRHMTYTCLNLTSAQ